MSGRVYPLQDSQIDAVDPLDSVWLSASAGTGKTQVLSARVLRLLLQPEVSPSEILCLTFTKAGAAEMAVRVNAVLADWVRMADAVLAKDLLAIGAPNDTATIARARTIFAHVLDCPGGGLRIDTIHAFSQWLLAAFPQEAGLTPGTRAMEDRDRELLAHEVLAQMLLDAEATGDAAVLDTLAALSLRMGADGVQSWLMRCADAREAWMGKGAWVPPLRPRVNRLLGLAADASEEAITTLCADNMFDVRSLRTCRETLESWGTPTGRKNAGQIAEWLMRPLAERAEAIGELAKALLTNEGAIRSLSSVTKIRSDYGEYAECVRASIEQVRERQALLSLAEWLTPALELGRKFALAWDAAKTREGLIDFDDQIRRAAELLDNSEMADWIRYKLDRRFNHILVDEAQDTNEAQWRIINALTGDFFTGEGAHGDTKRTLFVVGDYKQAIFRFQGTSPENFKAAQKRVQLAMQGAADNAVRLRGSDDVRSLVELGLGRSYRTAQNVLDFVDAAICSIGHERLGLNGKPEAHRGENRPGLVCLWPPVGATPDDNDDGDKGGEGWLSAPDRRLADRIAKQVRSWIDDGFPLVKGETRRAGPGDVMVLVRKRKELAGLIVARLHAAGVPVAGVDRLRLGAPLAVKDLLAALRFAAQPLDDHNLANLLVSPLMGWSQDQLLEHVYRPDKQRLWAHLRRSSHPDVLAVRGQLSDLLALADFEAPQALLHWILVGPWRGRERLVARLGREANDPIDELLNAALAYAATHTPSLQGFIRWFDAGEGELKRDAGASNGLVRVMTVHGSKGLQAPIVILADAAGNPDSAPTRDISLTEAAPEGAEAAFHLHTIPLPSLRKDQKFGRIAVAEAEVAKAEREEHWRLLYVAMTRAEEALFIAGSLGKREREPAPESWYAKLASLFPAEATDDPIWGERREIGSLVDLPAAVQHGAKLPPAKLPDWVRHPVGPEPRPPRPLAPSAAGEDQNADPPFPPGAAGHAARRGVLLHRLLERLPEVPSSQRQEAASTWLAKTGADIDIAERQEMARSALAVLSDPKFAQMFDEGALAEVPLAAIVGGQVITGTVDRLLITNDHILVIDYKTTRLPPTSLNEVPLSTLRQMAAYAAALSVIYPGRTVEVAVLYTQAPQLIAIPAAMLDRHKPVLTVAE